MIHMFQKLCLQAALAEGALAEVATAEASEEATEAALAAAGRAAATEAAWAGAQEAGREAGRAEAAVPRTCIRLFRCTTRLKSPCLRSTFPQCSGFDLRLWGLCTQSSCRRFRHSCSHYLQRMPTKGP